MAFDVTAAIPRTVNPSCSTNLGTRHLCCQQPLSANARIAARSACACFVHSTSSRQELLLDLVVGYELACVRLAKTLFDFRDEAQPFDGVLDRRLFGQCPKCLDGSLLHSDFHVHGFTVVE